MQQLCEMCGATIAENETAFHLKMELFAEPDLPEITEEDLACDVLAEMQALIEAMEHLDPDEAEDEVHEAYLFTLCGVCRKKVHQWLRAMRPEL